VKSLLGDFLLSPSWLRKKLTRPGVTTLPRRLGTIIAALVGTGFFLALCCSCAVADDGDLPSVVDPRVLYARSLAQWRSRSSLPYEAFTVRCLDFQFSRGECGKAQDVRVTIHLADGLAHIQTIESDPRTLIDNRMVWGPQRTALGFSSTNRDTASGVAAAPFQDDDVQAIGRVTSATYNYNVVFGGERSIDGVAVYHLYLNPIREPQKYLLREMDVEADTDAVRRILYRRSNGYTDLEVTYEFAALGGSRVWGLTQMVAVLRGRARSATTTIRFRDFSYLDRVPSDYFSAPLLPTPIPTRI
jgi:hypothetical protein